MNVFMIYWLNRATFRTRKSEYVFYSSQFLVQMFIPIAFVLFFHHHVNNDAYLLKRGVSIYYLISEKKVEQKVTQKNFNQHVIPENLRWAFSYINLQYVRKTMIAQQYNVVWSHFRKLNKKTYISLQMYLCGWEKTPWSHFR